MRQSLVIIESPYAGDIRRNEAYAKLCLLDSLTRGEAPIASHLLFPQVLNEHSPAQRRQGIEAGLAWMAKADCVAFYRDFGISDGMIGAMCEAQRLRIPIENRYLGRVFLESQLKWHWWHRFIRPHFDFRVNIKQPARQQSNPPAKNSEQAVVKRAKPTMSAVLGYKLLSAEMPDNEQQAFINQTLARKAPSPVPYGEANKEE